MPEADTPPEETPKPRRKAATSEAGKLNELKKKYRLDEEVKLVAEGPDKKRLGIGPVLDPSVFNRFAELDTSKNKRYLDWMLYQAGGGATAFKHSRELWGDFTPEIPLKEFFNSFQRERPDQVIHPDEVRTIQSKLNTIKDIRVPRLMDAADAIEEATRTSDAAKRFHGVFNALKKFQVVPGDEERIAVEILANKFKGWIRNQLKTKVRDRVHVTSVFSRVCRAMPYEEAEKAWKEMESKRRQEYVFGDQDSLKWETFGFNRHWPGRNNIYEQVWNQMRAFLSNLEQIQAYNSRIENYNKRAEEKNKTLPPDQQIAPRKGQNIPTDIGKVMLDKKFNLEYKGAYPTLYELQKKNEEVSFLPMKERVISDVRFAGRKGIRTKDAKLYSDQNLDVVMPLTVAAAIQSGHPSWPVSSPSQFDTVRPQGSYDMTAWTKYAAGEHGHPEWAGTKAISIFFHVKVPSAPPELQRIYLMIFLDDLVELQPPYIATIWKVPAINAKMNMKTVLAQYQRALPREEYLALVRSITGAMKTLREWGKEFDVRDITTDYVKHHREKLQKPRTLGEQVRIRAEHVVACLLQ